MLTSVRSTAPILSERHYLGPTKKAQFAWADSRGVLVFDGPPRSRHLPVDWLELVRWCIVGGQDAGSQQWSAAAAFLRSLSAERFTTVVSYSDPSQGHTGALYRACNWLWAPTWHRLRPPPSGNGAWTKGEQQAVKDRWVFLLRPDDRRESALAIKDESVIGSMGWASYHEPKWKRGRFDPRTGGGDHRRFLSEVRVAT